MSSHRVLVMCIVVLMNGCGSFDPSGQPNTAEDASADVSGPVGASPEAGSGNDGGGNVDGGTSSGPCKEFREEFEAFAPSAGGWGVVTNVGAAVATAPAWNGRALSIHYNTVASGTINAFATHGFLRSDASCSLVITLDARVRPSTTGRWFLVVVQGSAGGKVSIEHEGSFWYLNAGNSRQQIPFAPNNEVEHIVLTLKRSGAHDIVSYQPSKGAAVPLDDPTTVIGDGVDLQLGGQVQGTTTGANDAEIDGVIVTW